MLTMVWLYSGPRCKKEYKQVSNKYTQSGGFSRSLQKCCHGKKSIMLQQKFYCDSILFKIFGKSYGQINRNVNGNFRGLDMTAEEQLIT